MKCTPKCGRTVTQGMLKKKIKKRENIQYVFRPATIYCDAYARFSQKDLSVHLELLQHVLCASPLLATFYRAICADAVDVIEKVTLAALCMAFEASMLLCGPCLCPLIINSWPAVCVKMQKNPQQSFTSLLKREVFGLTAYRLWHQLRGKCHQTQSRSL